MLSTSDFDFVRRLVRESSAIALDDSKSYLAQSRLDALARQEGLNSTDEVVALLRTEPSGRLRRKVVDAMTTNETSFFRDIQPFEQLRQELLPDLITRRTTQRRLVLWSAACSSGQEPYSLAMLIREHFPSLLGWHLTIVATDLSTQMVERTAAGRYTQMEVNRGIPAALLIRYFRREGLDWVIDESLRRMVEVRQANLAGELPSIPRPDIVLLRNVLIYFEPDMKRQILTRMSRIMAPDGYLLLGGAENVLDAPEAFERAGVPRAGVYRPKAGSH